MNTENIPTLLKSIPQWVCWRYIPRVGGKPAKKPFDPKTGDAASATNPATWATFVQAAEHYQQHPCVYHGVGFVITGNMPLIGTDLDDCVIDGHIETWAQSIIDDIDSYAEISPSGRGVRVWSMGTIPTTGRKCGDVEMYSDCRYLTVTGNHIAGTPNDVMFQPHMTEIFNRLFPQPQPQPLPQQVEPVVINTGVVCVGTDTANSAELDDDSVLRVMFKSKHGNDLMAIWNGKDPQGDPSKSDLFLCSALAYYTQKDPTRIERLFRQSNRLRDKLDRKARQGEHYLEGTIKRAIQNCRSTYNPGTWEGASR